jgi:hypothetical protein
LCDLTGHSVLEALGDLGYKKTNPSVLEALGDLGYKNTNPQDGFNAK